MNASKLSRLPAANEAECDSLLELVEHLTDRIQAGESFDAAALAAAYPTHAQRLQELLPALEVLAEIGWSASASRPNSLLAADPLTCPHAPDGTLGDYRIHREIGRGGMGVVYEAEEISLRRRVALKVLPFAAVLDPRQLKRFQNEAMAAAQLKHPHIVSVYAVGCERGVNFYAMEYIEGQSLAQLIAHLRAPRDVDLPAASGTINATGELAIADTLRASGLTLRRSTKDTTHFKSAARLGRELAEALEHAHQMGVIHRDVKPANLLVDQQGSAWITDFGLAQFDTDAGLTMTGDMLGTLRYMSPEQARGARRLVDHRTDIYSLGITLYELLTLRPAFAGSNRQELLRQVGETEPPPPRQVQPDVPKDLETIVLKAIAKDPLDRYQTAQDLADDLGRYLGSLPIQARRPKLLERLVKWSRRHVRGLLVAYAVLSVMAFGLVAAIGLIWREQGRTATARREMAELLASRNVGSETKTAGERALAGNSAHRPGHLSDQRFAGLEDDSPILPRGPPETKGLPTMPRNSWLRKITNVFDTPSATVPRRSSAPRKLALEPLESRTLLAAAVFTVTSTADTVDADDGVLTLREAIFAANAHPNDGAPDQIHFNIPTTDSGFSPATGAFTIRPDKSSLWVFDPVVVDGWSQPGWAGAPIIELDGSLQPNDWGHQTGLVLFAGDSTVRGLVVNRFEFQGLSVMDFALVDGSNGGRNVIQGCYLGTDVTGTQPLGNGGSGIELRNSAGHNLIGTNGDGVNDALERNVISGNGVFGVRVYLGVENIVAGNYIGTNATGTAAVPNVYGVESSGIRTLIGTNADGVADEVERNIIAGNAGYEVLAQGPEGVVAGNYIGLDVTGTRTLGGATFGVFVHLADRSRVGTNGDGINDTSERNVIAGSINGVLSGGANDVVVAGNYVGTDATGTVALTGQTQTGWGIGFSGTRARVGTDGDGISDDIEGNVVGGYAEGIRFEGDNHQVSGNFIGVSATGQPLGNTSIGLVAFSTNNQIGGEGVLGNTIAYNGSHGVWVRNSARGNSIRGNSIHSNFGLGIELGEAAPWLGVTANDPGDADTGENNLQNFPVLASVSGGAETRVTGTLNSLASTSFIIDFYANSQADPSGHGEGERWLGKTIVTTDASGNASFDVVLPAASDSGEHITSTATRLADHDGDSDTPLVETDTSEFSAGVEITNSPPSAQAGGPYIVPEGGTVVLDASGSTDADQDSDTLSYEWDLNYDGATFNPTVAGVAPTFDAALLDGPTTRTVAVRVTDAGGASEISVAPVAIENVAPTAGISGPAQASAGEAATFLLSASDPSQADSDAGFTFQIDWGGDGQIDQTVHPGDSLEVQHSFSQAGPFTIHVTAIDQHGAASDAVTHAVQVIQPVQIDVRDVVNLQNQGVIAVAVISTGEFDASQVEIATVQFAGAAAVQHSLQDVNGDGRLDLVLNFRTQDTNLRQLYEQLLADDINADGILDSNKQLANVSLTAQTVDEVYIEGFDTLNLFLSGKHLRDLLNDLANRYLI